VSPGRSQTFMFHQTGLYDICRYEGVATVLIFIHRICSRYAWITWKLSTTPLYCAAGHQLAG
jgi:hypothetical protein